MSLGDTKLNECLDDSEVAYLWATTEEHCDIVTPYQETIRQAFLSDSAERYDEKLTQAINNNHDRTEEKRKKIENAVNKGELEARVEIRAPGFDDGFKELTDKNRARKIKDGYLRENGTEVFVRININRDDFKAWLIKSKQWPLADGCLLINWLKDMGNDGTKKAGVYQQKDVDFKLWISVENPDLGSMKKEEIQKQLVGRGTKKIGTNSNLWQSGFNDWWKEQDFYKGRPGRRPG